MSRRQSIALFTLSAILSFIVLSLSIFIIDQENEIMPTLARLEQSSASAQVSFSVPNDVELSVENQYVVQLDETTSRDVLDDVLADLDADIITELPQIQGVVIEFNAPLESDQLETLSSVVLVEPNYTVQSLLTYPTNDPLLDEQWAWNKIDIPRLWAAADQDADVTIAVIDSGVCFNHPDLQGRFLDNGFDFVDSDNDPSDEMGHGCAISGIIAAHIDNGIGIAGITPHANILPIRVLDAQGIGTYANVMSAIHYAVDNGADIINLSLGGQNYSQLLEQAVNYATTNGVHVVAGSGNTGQQGVLYPAKFNRVIAVGSSDINGNRSTFSTYGNEVDTLAPGENIITTALSGGYSYFTGTSMAAPHVSALLALSGDSIDIVDFVRMMPTVDPFTLTMEAVQALDVGTNTPTAPVPTPTFVPISGTSTPTSFSCDNIDVAFRTVPFVGREFFMDFINHNPEDAYLVESTIAWDKTPVAGDYPDIYMSAMALDNEIYWTGNDTESTTVAGIGGEGTLLYDPSVQDHNIFVPSGGQTIVWKGQFLLGPQYLNDYFDIQDFAGTRFVFDNPSDSQSPCTISVSIVPQPTATSTMLPPVTASPIPTLEPTATPILYPDNLVCTHNVPVSDAASLISNLESALAAVGDDVICLGGGTYTLTTRHNGDVSPGYNGLPTIDSTITILGNDSIIERTGASTFRFFNITTTGTLKLIDTTLINGYGTGGIEAGGAIYSEGTLYIIDSIFTDNYARNGGAIYPYYGEIVIQGSEFSHNGAEWGGAIQSGHSTIGPDPASLRVTDTLFYENTAERGGAIFNRNYMDVTHSRFIGNTATEHSAAVFSMVNSPTTRFDENCVYGNVSTSLTDKTVIKSDFTFTARYNWWGNPNGLVSNQHYQVNLANNLTAPPAACMQVDVLEYDLYPNDTVDFTLNESTNGTAPYTYTNLSYPWFGSLSGTHPSYSYFADFTAVAGATSNSQYTATDADGYSATGQVTFQIREPLQAVHQTVVGNYTNPIPLYMRYVGGIRPISYTEPSLPVGGTISGTMPNYQYVVGSNFTGSETITYDVTDARGATVTNSWTIELTELTIQDYETLTAVNTNVDLPLTISGGLPPYEVSSAEVMTLGQISGTYPNLEFVPFADTTGFETVTLVVEDDLGTVATSQLSLTVCDGGQTYIIPDGDEQALIRAINTIQNPICGSEPGIIELAQDGLYQFNNSLDTTYGPSALPLLHTDMTINGNDAKLERLDTASPFRIMTLQTDLNVTINVNNLIIANGYAKDSSYYSDHGGGAFVGTASIDDTRYITLDGVRFDNNNADSRGHAVYSAGQNIVIKNGAFLQNGNNGGNSTLFHAGYALDGLLLENNIFYDNNQGGYVVYDDGYTTLRHNTFWQNGGYNLYANGHETTIEGNIFGESETRSCSGFRITSLGYNIAADDYCDDDLIAIGDQFNTPSGIGALVYTDGSIIPALSLTNDSPALDGIPVADCHVATDVYGTARPIDSDGDGTAACEIGALELDSTDFVIQKSADKSTINSGDAVQFTISISNQGPLDAEGVNLTDVLSPHILYTSSSPSKGTYNSSTGFWQIGELLVGQSATLVIDTTVLLPASGTIATNTATFAGATVVDNNNDYAASVSVAVACPAASVMTVADGDTVGLITAVQAANNEACFPGVDTITLATDGSYTFDSVFEDKNALPSIFSEIIVNANNAEITRPISSTTELRFFNVLATGNLTLNDVTLSQGYLENDGGGAIYSEGTLTLNNATFSENVGSPGGAIYQLNGVIDIQNSQFLDNKTPVGNSIYNRIAGAIVLTHTDATINQTEFHRNRASAGSNSSSYGGGAMKIYESNVDITNSLFQGNSTSGGSGGAIYISADSDSDYQTSIVSTSFIDNYTPSNGGALVSFGTIISIDQSLFWDNYAASGSGGAVSLTREASIHNSTFYGNTGWQNGAIAMSSISADLSYLTIVGNHTLRTITGAFDFSGGPIRHSILANNTGGNGNCSSKFTDSGGYNVSDDANCGFDQPTDLNSANIVLSTFGYHGNARQSFIPESANLIDVIPPEICATAIDQHGTIRPVGSGCDIGAVEVTGNELLPPYDLYINQGDYGDIWAMTWQNDPPIDGYEIQHVWQLSGASGTSSQEFITIDNTATSYPIDTATLTCDALHNYLIRSYRTIGDIRSNWSTLAYFYLPCTIELTPTNLSGTAISLSEIELSWTSVPGPVSGSPAMSVDIQQFNDGSNRWDTRLEYFTGDSIVLNGFSCDRSYQFRIRTNDNLRYSDYTSSLLVDMPLCPINTLTDLTAALDGQDNVVLSWTDNNTYEDHYIVERSSQPDSWELLATLPADSITYTDITTLQQTTYTYRVRAYISLSNRYSANAEIGITTPPPRQMGPTYIVTTPNDTDSVCYVGQCSLREAIKALNLTQISGTINFDMPGTAPYQISLTSDLPHIEVPVVLDGWSQAGWVDKPIIWLDAINAGVALGLKGGDSTVRGFVINGYFSIGIYIPEGNNNRIFGNYVGVDTTGTTDITPGYAGIDARSENNTIGGPNPNERNIVSGNGTGILVNKNSIVQNNIIGLDVTGTLAVPNGTGINTVGSIIGGEEPNTRNYISSNATAINTEDSTIKGNYIGTDITGLVAFTQGNYGVRGKNSQIGGYADSARNIIVGFSVALKLDYSTIINNYIGVDVTGESALPNESGIQTDSHSVGDFVPNTIIGNVISGNTNYGMQFWNPYHTIQGNYIGVSPTLNPVPNGTYGIFLGDYARRVKIGGDTPNVIANNGLSGIYNRTDIVTISQNKIYNNGLLGIEHFHPGIATINSDKFPTPPHLTYVSNNTSQVQLIGHIIGQPEHDFTVEFFANDNCDPSGYGEGQTYLASTTVQSDVFGYASFEATLNISVSEGVFFAATATDETLIATSGFSECIGANPATLAPPSNVVASAISSTQVDISWSDNSTDETAFYIERSISGTVWAVVDTVADNANQYSDVTVTCDTGYHYRMRAYRNSDTTYSAYSNLSYVDGPPCDVPDDPILTVTTTDDTADGVCDSHCSLRDAVIQANAQSGLSTILVPSGTYILTIPFDAVDTAANGDLDLTTNIIFKGDGIDQTILDGNNVSDDRALTVSNNATVVIEDLTIQNFHSSTNTVVPWQWYGGALANLDGDVTVRNVKFYNNHAEYQGDAILNVGVMRIYDSEIARGEQVQLDSSPYAILNDGNIEIHNSHIHHNEKVLRLERNAHALISNSLIVDNYERSSSSGQFGAVGHGGVMMIQNSTLSNNVGDYLFSYGAATVLSIKHSVLKHDSQDGAKVCGYPDIITDSKNVFSDDSCVYLSPTDDITNTDPLLDANYMPYAESPAFDAGVLCPPTDINGVSRPLGAACDLGAVESAFLPMTPPINLTGTLVNYVDINLSWQNQTTHETAYVVERSLDNLNWVDVVTLATNVESYDDTSLECFTDYYYRVSSQLLTIRTPSHVIQVTTVCEPITPPSSLVANLNAADVNLSWQDNDTTETHFEIQRRISGSVGWDSLQIVSANIVNHTDATATCETSYEYQISAYRDQDNTTATSNIVNITTSICPVNEPNTFAASNATETTIDLSWNDVATNETGYELYQVGDTTDLIADLPINTQAYTVTDLTCDTAYVFEILAFREINASRQNSTIIQLATSTDRCHVQPPVDPIPLAVTRNIANISWQDSTPEQTSHIIIERAIDTNGGEVAAQSANLVWDVLATLPTGSSSYNDDNLMCGTTYWYRMQGYDQQYNEYSAYSDTLQVITSECPVAVTNTIGVYRDGFWAFRNGFENDTPITTFRFGPMQSGWIPLTGDWDGDGIDGIGLYKDGVFALRDISENGVIDYLYRFGNANAGWQPIVGDWDGNDTVTVGLYRDGQFMLTNSHDSPSIDYQFNWTSRDSDWIAIAGDWNGNGRDRVGLYKDGVFYLLDQLKRNANVSSFRFGTDSGWLPIAGDWDADGTSTIGLYKDNSWRLRNSNSRGNVDIGFRFDGLGDGTVPLASYRGGEEAIEALALFATSVELNINPETTQAVDPIVTATSTLSPTSQAVVSPTQGEMTPTITSPVSATATDSEPTVMIPASATATEVEPTITATAEPTAVPATATPMPVVPTAEPTTVPSATPMPTEVPATAIPTEMPQPVVEPEATDEVQDN